MPPAPPPPHDGPCKRCQGDEDVCKLGRYRGLCATCRPIVAVEQKEARAARAAAAERDSYIRSPSEPAALPGGAAASEIDQEIEKDIRARGRQPKLSSVCQQLVVHAEKLEGALGARKQATMHAQAALFEFKDTLRMVARVAQSLANQSGTTSKASP